MSAWADNFRAEVAPHVAGLRSVAHPSPAQRAGVLLVEDDAFAAELTVKALELSGCEVAVVSSAPAALAALRRSQPKVILMDVNLPGMDGLALTEWLKASPSFGAIPVVMLTADSRRETIARSKTAGAAGFLVKPFTREALFAKIATFIRAPEPTDA
jgi:CheY-like chemotaxis protein